MKAFDRLFWVPLLASIVIGLGSTTVVGRATAEEHHASAGAASHESAEHHAPSVGELLFPAINFTVYLFIVVRFVVPAMREYLRRRHSEVIQAQSESAAALTRAQSELTSSKARLADLKAEADGIRQDLVAIAVRQAERLKVQAEETGARRLADAALLAEQERRRALATLRGEIASEATRLAEGKIRGALTAEDQRRFVRQFLKEASTQ